MDEWHYQRGETTFGPISGEMLHALIQRGRLQASTPVRRSDVTEWSTVAEVQPSLPSIPEAATPPPEEFTNAQPFDSSLPGASEVYAPPQSALLALPQTHLPPSLWFGFILCAGALLFEIACWISMAFIHLSGLSDVAAWPHGLQGFAMTLKNFVSHDLALTASMVGTITIVLWQGCAFASLQHLYGGLVRRSRASGLWWLVPIANLFKPLQCLRDMRYLSRTRRDVPNSHASFGPLLIALESLILISFLIRVLEVLSPGANNDGEDPLAILLVRDFALIAFATTFLVIVITNFRQQKRLYAHWDDNAYWQNPRSR